MGIKRRPLPFLRNASNLDSINQPGIVECPSSRLRISLPRRIVSAKIPKRKINREGAGLEHHK
jgi:hypothetical protein